jgi:hypothetical protein
MALQDNSSEKYENLTVKKRIFSVLFGLSFAHIIYKDDTPIWKQRVAHQSIEGDTMSDILGRIREEQDVFGKLLGKVPGFNGYFDREQRRMADKMLRETVAARYEEQWRRISALQRELISQGGLAFVDDLEGASIKLRQFIDRVRSASYGYSGFFDAVKIRSEELDKLYQYDLWMLSLVDEIGRAIDNVEASFGTDGLPAAIRHLVRLSQESVEAYNKRSETILEAAGAGASAGTPAP